MAVVNVSSLGIQGLEAQSGMLIRETRHSGRVHFVADKVSKATTDSAASILRILRIPSHVRLIELRAFYGAFGAGATVDIGVYETPANGGAAVNATLFQTAHNNSAATSVPADVLFPPNPTVDDYLKMFWQRLGLSSDPQKMYDIAIKLGATPGANAADFGLGGAYVE